MSSSFYVLILAGGSGERFWPLSRKARPKQLLSLFSEATLLEQTVERLDGLVPLQNILILTNQEQEPAVRALLTRLPPENIVAEPAKRDTAAAIALGAAWVAVRDVSATMAVLPADHLIQNKEGFQKTLRTAATAAAHANALITVGIRPTWACPGFGYIEMGPRVDGGAGPDSPPVFEVARFREKPSVELAETFWKQDNFRWNAGMFIWTIPAILSAFARHAPELAAFIEHVRSSGDLPKILAAEFPTLPKISIDYAIMEKTGGVLVVEAAFDWDDVGGWMAAAKYLARDSDGNASNTPLTQLESRDNIVFSAGKKHVALMGVSDLIVIETADAVFVCRKQEAERIKQIVSHIPEALQ